jgi:hypothetical protein
MAYPVMRQEHSWRTLVLWVGWLNPYFAC